MITAQALKVLKRFGEGQCKRVTSTMEPPSILARCSKSEENSVRLCTLFGQYHDTYEAQGNLLKAIEYSKMALDALSTNKIQRLLSLNDGNRSLILSPNFQRATCLTCLTGSLHARLNEHEAAAKYFELSLTYIRRFKEIDDSLFVSDGENDGSIPVDYMEGSINHFLAIEEYYLNSYRSATDHALQAALLLEPTSPPHRIITDSIHQHGVSIVQ